MRLGPISSCTVDVLPVCRTLSLLRGALPRKPPIHQCGCPLQEHWQSRSTFLEYELNRYGVTDRNDEAARLGLCADIDPHLLGSTTFSSLHR